MRKYKLLFMTLLLAFTLAISFNVQAKTGDTYYNDSKSHSYKVTEEVVTEQYGVTYNALTGTTVNGSKKKAHLFSMKTDGTTSKLVTWAFQDGINKYKRLTVRDLAKDYEKNHPGWKVVAGINGDQFGLGFGTNLGASGTDYYQYQTYYPFFMDGERRFSISAAGFGNGIGFINDGSKKGFVDTVKPTGFRIEILDEDGNILSTYPIDVINEAPESGKTGVWFSYINSEKTYQELTIASENDLYLVSQPEVAYMSNNDDYTYKPGWNYDHVFGRGTIDQVVETCTIKSSKFVIDTSNADLLKELGVGVRVRVQSYYDNEVLNNVEAVAGYHSVQRKNDKDIPIDASNSYNKKVYPRAVFGIKADGTYVLMNVDGVDRPQNGLTGEEINAVLKGHNVVEAYQCDGGGSATAIWRNAEGGFDVVNYPTDGNERTILTALFFVVKDCGVQIDSIDATDSALTFNLNTDNVNKDVVTKLYCTLNGETKEIVDNKVTFDGLKSFTDYTYSFTYDTNNKKGNDGLVNGKVNTSKILPTITELKTEILDGKVIFTPVFNDPDAAFDYIRICIGDTRYPYLDEPIEIEVETGLSKLDYVLTYCYNLEDGKGKIVIEEEKTLVLKEDDPTDPGDNPDNPGDDPTNPDNPGDEPTNPNNPSDDKESGCKKDISMVIVSLISLSSLLVLIKKRK